MKFRKNKYICAPILLFALIFTVLSPISASERLLPGGMPFGVKICCDGVLVVGVGEVETKFGKKSPAKDAGICPKDIIVSINGRKINSANDVTSAVEYGEESLKFDILRNGENSTVEVFPVKNIEDKFRVGIWVRDSTAGIGTVTFIDPETGAFAGLGHGICDSDTGELMPLKRGVVVDVTINGIVKGQSGTPGELKGCFSSGKVGSLIGNTECGVFGVFGELPEGLGRGVETAEYSELCEGDAELICTLDEGGRRRYRVKISDIDCSGRDVKNFVVSVVDERLLERTGGIVQGMSGSPIIQNGKLIGAVTHVMIGDPSRGYGIFIGNMLKNMPKAVG